MSKIEFLQLLQQTIVLILTLAAPVLVTSMTVGIGISIFQTVTSIQESTLTFVPKIMVSLMVLLAMGPWILNKFVDSATDMYHSLAVFAHSH